jgi:hypothetical protein
MLITFPYGTKNQAVQQPRPMWTWVTGPPKQRTFLLPNTAPQSPGPGYPRADLSHSINRDLTNWYPLNHGNSIGTFDIGPYGLYLPSVNTLEGAGTDGPRGQCTAYRSQHNKYTGDNSAFLGTVTASESPMFSTSANWTISCWVRVNLNAGQGDSASIFGESQTYPITYNYSSFSISGGELHIHTRRVTHSSFHGSIAIDGTGWRHCVGVKIGSGGELYLDGEIDPAPSPSGSLKTQSFSGTDQVRRQTSHPNSSWSLKTGDFCNLRAWRRALDKSEIKELYHNPWVGLAGSPVIIGTQEAGATAGRNLMLLGVG